jgi:ADP-heptose:LPS heptosyltransferase
VEFRKFLLTHPVPYGQSDYDTKSNFDLIEAIHVPFRFRNPHLEISPEEADWAKSRVPPNAIGIQPGARFGEKQIPADVVRTVAAEIESAGRTIILLGGKEERETSEKLGLKAVNWVGETTIRESLAVLSQLSLMIGGDTGLMHMAAAVSCPTVTVFGPTPLEKWAHRYEPHVSIQAQGRIIRNITSEELLTAIRPRLRT